MPGVDGARRQFVAGSLRSQSSNTAVSELWHCHVLLRAPAASRFFEGQDIQLTQNLTIDGGAGATIDASRSSRIFFVNGGNVLLDNLTLENGSAAGGDGSNGGSAGGGGASGMGGAIFLNAGTLSIANSTLSSNQAQGGSGGRVINEGHESFGGGGGLGGDNMRIVRWQLVCGTAAA